MTGHTTTVPAEYGAPITDVLAGAARRHGDRVALRHEDQELSYAALYGRACAVAHALRDAGVRPGEVVAVRLASGPAYPVGYYGILLAGATATPVSPMLTADAARRQLVDCEAVAVLVEADGDGLPGAADTGMLHGTAVRLALVLGGTGDPV
ncbi:MAG TPA: AMP-binding protein, partial [Streptomyces sp.]|nr:AMP-binding protein [Streptomyces sp.]